MTLIDNEPQAPNKSTEPSSKDDPSQWGYDMYPERRHRGSYSGFSALIKGKGRENIERFKCEQTVYECVQKSPLVRLMMGALHQSGCTVDIRRHIACEECAPTVSGGYDPVLNQVVICQNAVKSKPIMQSVLTHEMIHMFDYCRNELNFRNLDHLACTEIRAANLAHCSFLAALTQGDIPMFRVREAHQYCVKNKALSSIMAARNVDKAEAMHAIERVFDRCYADLEPIGRRIRRNSEDILKANAEGFYYGYDQGVP